MMRRRMRHRAPYAVLFAGAVVLLFAGAVASFRVIGTTALSSMAADSAARSMDAWPVDSLVGARPVASSRARADYEKFAAEDAAWRARNARAVSLSELRARGDGRRSARESMEDRVYRLERAGRRASAIAELERWVGTHGHDRDALLSLARLLRDAGRTDDALRRYRQALGDADVADGQ
jgi:hypothetical protein